MKFLIKSYKNKMNKFVIILLIFSFISCEKLSFQSKLFSYLQESPSKNICISPLSIYHILSLFSNGAIGETLSEIINTLIPDKENNSIEKSQSLLNINNINILNIYNSNNEKVKIANAILSKISMTKHFIEIGKKYNALIDTLRDEKQVNDWCSEKTNGKIKKIIDQIDPLTRMILLNAVYFKGNWKYKFKKEKTTKRDFQNGNGKISKVETMYAELKDVNYYINNEVEIVELPYEDPNLSMVIILPSKKYTSAYDYIKRNNDFTKIFKNLKTKKEMALYLPKFELEYEKSLKKALQKMNMRKVFGPSAELMKLSESGQLYVDEVIHKTYIKVDEEGSEAAAITAIVTKFLCVNKPKITIMNVNRSFVYMIRDKRIKDTNGNEMMLFVGTVNDLSNEKK